MRDRDPGSSDGLWTAFEAEAMPHADRLFRLAMWWERDRREAEDLVQDTLVQALQSFHRFTAGTNCRAWLVSILQHVRSNRRRTKLRRITVEDPDDRIANAVPFVPRVPQHLSDEDVLAALRGIPEAARRNHARRRGAPGPIATTPRLDAPRPTATPSLLPATDGFQVASFQGARHAVFVVSSLNEDDVQEVARAMVGPVSRVLSGAS